MDAYKAWFSRLDPTATPLGREVKHFDSASRPTPASVHFRGYTLDAAGVPTFLFRRDGRQVRLRIAPNPEGGLTQRFSATLANGEVEETEEAISWE